MWPAAIAANSSSSNTAITRYSHFSGVDIRIIRRPLLRRRRATRCRRVSAVARAVTGEHAHSRDITCMTLPTYADHTQWRDYQPHFPPAMRCTPDTTPREEYWRWRDLDVHVDHMGPATAKLKIIVLHGAGAYGR